MAEKEFNFEKSLERLEEIVNLLEEGKASLDDSLKLFQEGISLVKNCETKLKDVEDKATKILENGVTKDFNVEDADK